MSDPGFNRNRSGSTPIPVAQPPGKGKVTLRKLVSGIFQKKDGMTMTSPSPSPGISEDDQSRKSSRSLGEIKTPMLATFPQMPAQRQPIARQHSLLSADDAAAAPPRKALHTLGMEEGGEAGPHQRRRSRSFLGESGEISARLEGNAGALSPGEQALLFQAAQWKMGSRLGAGTFGAVWAGIFKPNGKTYAVKKIKCSAETDEEIRREVALLASLGGHRNIVRCFGGQLVAPGGFFWIVMEHMECGTLADIMGLTGEALSEGEAAAVLRDVCSGLGYLHNLGFIHKDIKPHNILMGARAIAKLADFGVSQKAPEADASEETPGRNAGGGTLAFMGPEVVRGQVCAKSDVWALGVTAIHLLTNVSPHEGLSDLQLAEAIVSGPPLRLPEGFSKEAQAAVESCLQPDLQERGSLNHVARLAFVAYAAPREKSLMPLVQRVLAIKEEREREEETARRRALVGGGKKPPVARE